MATVAAGMRRDPLGALVFRPVFLETGFFLLNRPGAPGLSGPPARISLDLSSPDPDGYLSAFALGAWLCGVEDIAANRPAARDAGAPGGASWSFANGRGDRVRVDFHLAGISAFTRAASSSPSGSSDPGIPFAGTGEGFFLDGSPNPSVAIRLNLGDRDSLELARPLPGISYARGPAAPAPVLRTVSLPEGDGSWYDSLDRIECARERRESRVLPDALRAAIAEAWTRTGRGEG